MADHQTEYEARARKVREVLDLVGDLLAEYAEGVPGAAEDVLNPAALEKWRAAAYSPEEDAARTVATLNALYALIDAVMEGSV